MAATEPSAAKRIATALFLGLLGIVVMGGAGYWALLTQKDLASWLRTTGVVEDFVARKDADGKTTSTVPKFVFKDATGKEFHFESTFSSILTSYSKGQQVNVLYPAAAPEKAIIDSFLAKWMGLLIAGGTGLVLLLVSPFAALKPVPAAGTAAVTLLPLEQRFDYHPLNADTVDSYLSSASDAQLPAGGGITAGAAAIPLGRYPVPLCEFCSYMAALVYADEAAILKHIADHCPGITNPRFLSNQNTEALAFQFEGVAFIVLRGTEGNRADWLRNFNALRTGPRDFIPQGVSWSAAPRHSGFAEGWHVIREPIETWIRDTRPADGKDMPFIFTGHSLGGALSFLGAYEFAKLGRTVQAVITFGAALPGGAAFGREYEALGLGVRTLRLEFDQDAVPIAQFPLLYMPVGFEWQLEKPPLTMRERTRRERFRSGLFSFLQSGLSTDKSPGGVPPLFRSPLMALVTILIYGVPAALAAVQAHNMQQRYALALSVLSYRRLRELGITQDSESEYAACYDRLCRHLERLRGTGPAEPKIFEFLKELPLRLASKADFDALVAKFPDRMI